MATSGSFYTNGYSDANSPDCYYVSWELTGQSIEGNYSDIKYSVVGAGGKNEYWYVYVQEKYVTVNGTTKSSTTIQETYNGTVAFSGTARIYHNNDGKKSFTISAGGAFYYYGAYNSTGSGTWELPQIARATTPSLAATSVTMGNTVRITLTPADSSFKHKLRYEFGSLVSQIAGLPSGEGFTSQGTTTHDFTPPTSLGSQIPSANSGTCKLICYTYKSDGTHIGTTNVNITLSVPSYTPAISQIGITGIDTLSDMYVQGKSKMQVAITATSSYGATIKSYSTVLDGKTYTGQSFTSSALGSGSKSAVVTVTDTRGKTASLTSAAKPVYAYSNPTISGFTVVRQSDGTTVVATVTGTVASVNSKNAKSVTVTLNGQTKTVTPSAYSVSVSATFTGVSTDKTFEAVAKLHDSYTYAEMSTILSTVKVTVDYYKDGTGIAFGKVAESNNLFECDWPAKLNKGLTLGTALPVASGGTGATTASAAKTALGIVTPADYITQTGTSSGWTYVKWNGGRIELWADKSLSFPAGTLVNGFYRSLVTIDLSSLLTKILGGTVCIQNNSMIPQFCRHSSTLTTAEVFILMPQTFSAITLTCPLYVIGTWK